MRSSWLCASSEEELFAGRHQFDKFLVERDFEEAEHVTAAIDAFFGDFIDNSLKTAKASAAKGAFSQAEQLERGANVAKIHLRNLRGKVDPRLTERIETILWESEQERTPLEAAKAKAVEQSRFAVAREASIKLRELTERYRRRVLIAYKTAVTASPVGTVNLPGLKMAMERVQEQLPPPQPRSRHASLA